MFLGRRLHLESTWKRFESQIREICFSPTFRNFFVLFALFISNLITAASPSPATTTLCLTAKKKNLVENAYDRQPGRSELCGAAKPKTNLEPEIWSWKPQNEKCMHAKWQREISFLFIFFEMQLHKDSEWSFIIFISLRTQIYLSSNKGAEKPAIFFYSLFESIKAKRNGNNKKKPLNAIFRAIYASVCSENAFFFVPTSDTKIKTGFRRISQFKDMIQLFS